LENEVGGGSEVKKSERGEGKRRRVENRREEVGEVIGMEMKEDIR